MNGSLIANMLMLVGALIWLAGELTGVSLDALHHARGPDTTSGWVWFAEHHWTWVRMIVAAGLAVLAVHFLNHG